MWKFFKSIQIMRKRGEEVRVSNVQILYFRHWQKLPFHSLWTLGCVKFACQSAISGAMGKFSPRCNGGKKQVLSCEKIKINLNENHEEIVKVNFLIEMLFNTTFSFLETIKAGAITTFILHPPSTKLRLIRIISFSLNRLQNMEGGSGGEERNLYN